MDCGAYLAGGQSPDGIRGVLTRDLKAGDVASYGFGFITLQRDAFKSKGRWFVKGVGRLATEHRASTVWAVKP